jgi:hypothetical protein
VGNFPFGGLAGLNLGPPTPFPATKSKPRLLTRRRRLASLLPKDVTGLDLLETELVVLSACEIGLGDVQVDEGVLGLRRAFILAGAKTLVMSLWKVPDHETQQIMGDFYRLILSGESRAAAWRRAQLAMKIQFAASLLLGVASSVTAIPVRCLMSSGQPFKAHRYKHMGMRDNPLGRIVGKPLNCHSHANSRRYGFEKVGRISTVESVWGSNAGRPDSAKSSESGRQLPKEKHRNLCF